ncbi:MAG: hypothetical protein HY318_17395 [Armatimonadetes bacterium]|nr:hypothetical protein [Armatimonadota bacterium]
MPVFRSGRGNPPVWGDLEDFEFVELRQGDDLHFARSSDKEEIIVCVGLVTVASPEIDCRLSEGEKLDLDSPGNSSLVVTCLSDKALVFRAMGRWKSITSSGIFTVQTAFPPTNDTPYNYEKTTGFDNHSHDCDEYWMIFEGSCRVASEGRIYDVGPGDCVATGMGWHHDVLCLLTDQPVRAIWFEGALEGRKRVGHLWEPVHGEAGPKIERV